MKLGKLPQKNTLDFWFLGKERIFSNLQSHTLRRKNKNKRRIFIDRGTKILFIAHLDTVLTPQIKRITNKRIYAQGLDDRLGCYAAFNLSKELGADLLLTDNEESMASTAEFHKCKSYNWVVEFDRGGSDVVTYELDNKKFRGAIKQFWGLGIGSFSDIAFLNTKACCMNVGVGYKKAHSEDSYVDLLVYNEQMKKFREFFGINKDRKFIAEVDRDFDDYFQGADDTPPTDKAAICEWCYGYFPQDELLFIEGITVCENCACFWGNEDNYGAVKALK